MDLSPVGTPKMRVFFGRGVYTSTPLAVKPRCGASKFNLAQAAATGCLKWGKKLPSVQAPAFLCARFSSALAAATVLRSPPFNGSADWVEDGQIRDAFAALRHFLTAPLTLHSDNKECLHSWAISQKKFFPSTSKTS